MSAGQQVSNPFGRGPVNGATASVLDCSPATSKPDMLSVSAPHISTDPPRTPRQRDRRHALLDLAAALTRCLVQDHDVSLMRGSFEEGLRRIVPVSAIQLRDMGPRS